MKERLIKVMASMLAVFATVGVPAFAIVYFNFAWIIFCQAVVIIILAIVMVKFTEWIFNDKEK